MKRIHLLNICGYPVRIVYKTNVVDKDKKDIKLLGLCEVDDQTILIRKGLKQEKFEEVLAHEVLHFIAETHCLRLNEGQINCLGIELSRFLRNNKNL